ncbi:MAG TPA: hypothetical protein DDW49_04610 [Deltaproteobacteria bacterium]|nr:hypothetical protein [Deltaproteobacteria bacterium]
MADTSLNISGSEPLISVDPSTLVCEEPDFTDDPTFDARVAEQQLTEQNNYTSRARPDQKLHTLVQSAGTQQRSYGDYFPLVLEGAMLPLALLAVFLGCESEEDNGSPNSEDASTPPNPPGPENPEMNPDAAVDNCNKPRDPDDARLDDIRHTTAYDDWVDSLPADKKDAQGNPKEGVFINDYPEFYQRAVDECRQILEGRLGTNTSIEGYDVYYAKEYLKYEEREKAAGRTPLTIAEWRDSPDGPLTFEEYVDQILCPCFCQ